MPNHILFDYIEDCNQSFLVTTDGPTFRISADKDVDDFKIESLQEFSNYIDNHYGQSSFANICKLFPAFVEFGNKLIESENHKDKEDNERFFIINFAEDNNNIIKRYTSPGYKYAFNTKNGTFMRWGKTIKTNPEKSLLGPEIADIEISTICHGNCEFCYKGNTENGKNMSIDTYKKVIDILNQNNTLTQVALGIGDVNANKDLEEILKYSRDNNIIPNLTIASNDNTFDDNIANLLVKYCGAISISNYNYGSTKDKMYKLCKAAKDNKDNSTLSAINIHQLICKETYDRVKELFIDIGNNELYKEAATNIVLLTFKNTNDKTSNYHMISKDEYKELIKLSNQYNLRIGFDSCGCSNFFEVIKEDPNYDYYKSCADSCESSLFSIYVDVSGRFFPCSFIASSKKLVNKEMDIPDVNNCKDLVSDIWYSKFIQYYRDKITNNRNSDTGFITCPFFDTNFR